jgi:hypothetical protein
VPEQEAVLERLERDAGYRLHEAAAERLADALQALPPMARAAAESLFFRKEPPAAAMAALCCGRARLYRARQEAVCRMAPECVRAYPVVRRWMEARDAERIQAVRLAAS